MAFMKVHTKNSALTLKKKTSELHSRLIYKRRYFNMSLMLNLLLLGVIILERLHK